MLVPELDAGWLLRLEASGCCRKLTPEIAELPLTPHCFPHSQCLRMPAAAQHLTACYHKYLFFQTGMC